MFGPPAQDKVLVRTDKDERCSKVETPLNFGVSNPNLQQVPQRNTTYYNDVKVEESELPYDLGGILELSEKYPVGFEPGFSVQCSSPCSTTIA